MTISEARMSPSITYPQAETFDALLRSHKQRLYGAAYSILRDHGEAEDALQEAMVKAWKGWNRVRDEKARSRWLMKICVNHCINRRRSLRRRLFASPLQERDSAPIDPRFQGRLLDLDNGYRRLSPQQRAAIYLHYHHGYSNEECAELMNCGAGSVRTHIARALTTLRKEMAHE